MRHPDVIMTNMARALTQWVTRTQAGWIVAPAGACVIEISAEPIVMAQSYINSDARRPHNHVTPEHDPEKIMPEIRALAAGNRPGALPGRPPASARRNHIGRSTVSTTWMTPFDCSTSAVVII